MKKILTKNRKKSIYAFIDAANLFYGGKKSLGWSIDYKKLLKYLREKYDVSRALYFAGIQIYELKYDPISDRKIEPSKLLKLLKHKIKDSKLSDAQIILIERDIQRTKFYQKLAKFGYILKLKPTKIYKQFDGSTVKKANCDVDLTFELMRCIEQYSGVVILSGDGDFVPVLKYLQSKKRNVTILARAERTAKEMRQLAGGDFKDFNYLRELIRFTEEK